MPNYNNRIAPPEIQRETVFIATIVEVLADTGNAIVLPNGASMSKESNRIVAALPYCDSITGAMPYPMYPAGSTVVCCWRSDRSTNVAYIIGVLDMDLDNRQFGYLSHKLYNAEAWTAAGSEARSDWALLQQMCNNGDHVWVRDRSHGVSGDAIAGDYDVLDKTGVCGLHVGRMLTQLKGSAMTFLDASVTDNKLRLVGDELSLNALTHETVVTEDYAVSNTAISLSEAFGLESGPVLSLSGDSPVLTSDTAIPLYRLQHMEGRIIDGSEDVVWGFSTDTDVMRTDKLVHDAQHEPPALSKRRRSLSGELLDASAYGISSIKSPMLTAIAQLGYGASPADAASGNRFDDLREPYSPAQKEVEGLGEAAKARASAAGDAARRDVSDAALNKLIDTLLEGEYRTTMLELLAEKGFSRTSQASTIYAAIGDKAQPGGPCDGAEYELPGSIKLIDPVTGAEKTYYASMSFITQEPDGSICLCDGYGSEIRMCRGNIYISPALDCFIRPGRDMSVMAGRHQAYNSQQTCTISTADSMYIRAHKDMKIGGATGGDGIVILESGNKMQGSDKGMVIKSMMDASFTVSGSLYMGRNRHVQTTQGALDTDDTTGGAVVIDAGNRGSLYMKGMEALMDVLTFTVCANTATSNSGGQGCAFTIDTGSIRMSTPLVWVDGSMRLAPAKMPMTVSVTRGIKSVPVTVSRTASSYSLELVGSLVSENSIKVNGAGVFCAGVLAKYVQGDSAYQDVSMAPPEAKAELQPYKAINIARADAPRPYDYAVLLDEAAWVYSNDYVTNNTFMFPETYSVNCAVMPGMVWQERADGGSVWDEKYIMGDTDRANACYPGIDVWESQTISVAGYKAGPLVQGGYKINVKQ